MWSQDVQLRMYPLPDLLVVADASEQFNYATGNCMIANPGSYALNGYGMTQYHLSSGQVERVAIDRQE